MIWRWIARPILFAFPAEPIHRFSMSLFNASMFPPVSTLTDRFLRVKDKRLEQSCFGLSFDNPIGLAAGFDKHASWFNSLSHLGFSHVEVGTITGQNQAGNSQPRLFRLPADTALINRMGFNNPGCESIANRLRGARIRPVLGINIGKTKVVENDRATEDYLASFSALYDFASYFTVNVSSPNTPNLRELQDRKPLEQLLNRLRESNESLSKEKQVAQKPILLKIAPDLTKHQLDEVVEIAVAARISGIIATNTTIARDGLSTPQAKVDSIGAGGLSGSPLTQRSLDVVRHVYQRCGGQLGIVGSGGVMTGADAWNLIAAGANLVQLYTGFVYGGPAFVRNVNRYILKQLQDKGLSSIDQAIGIDDRPG